MSYLVVESIKAQNFKGRYPTVMCESVSHGSYESASEAIGAAKSLYDERTTILEASGAKRAQHISFPNNDWLTQGLITHLVEGGVIFGEFDYDIYCGDFCIEIMALVDGEHIEEYVYIYVIQEL